MFLFVSERMSCIVSDVIGLFTFYKGVTVFWICFSLSTVTVLLGSFSQ